MAFLRVAAFLKSRPSPCLVVGDWFEILGLDMDDALPPNVPISSLATVATFTVKLPQLQASVPPTQPCLSSFPCVPQPLPAPQFHARSTPPSPTHFPQVFPRLASQGTITEKRNDPDCLAFHVAVSELVVGGSSLAELTFQRAQQMSIQSVSVGVKLPGVPR